MTSEFCDHEAWNESDEADEDSSSSSVRFLSYSASGSGTEGGGGGAILLHSCGSPDPIFMQQKKPFRS